MINDPKYLCSSTPMVHHRGDEVCSGIVDGMSPGRDLDPAVRWVRAYWNEPDLLGPLTVDLDASFMEFLYELDAAGYALRSIELMGKDRVPIGASSLADFWAAQDYEFQAATAALIANRAVYGGVPQGNMAEALEGYPVEEMTAEGFETEWRRARADLEDRPREDHFAQVDDGSA